MAPAYVRLPMLRATLSSRVDLAHSLDLFNPLSQIFDFHIDTGIDNDDQKQSIETLRGND